jgi:hypothetical protein
MESNDARLPTRRLCVVFRFRQVDDEIAHWPFCTLTIEIMGRFHYAAATVTVAVSDALTYWLFSNDCRRPTFCGSQR